MTRLYLIRHGNCEGSAVRLNGRTADVSLTPEGRGEAATLAELLARRTIRAIWSSPRARCLQTADIIASRVKRPVEVREELDEVDFGAWSGRAFSEFEGDPDWRRWNARRSEALTPAGDSVAAVQARMRRALKQAMGLGGDMALVTHAEPIRAAIADILGAPIDNWSRLAVSTASLTEIVCDAGGLTLVALNQTCS